MKKTGRGLTAFILIAVAIVFVLAASSVDSTGPSSHTITYIDPTSTNGNGNVVVSYDGIAATEYNPLLWNNTGLITAENWNAPSNSAICEFIDGNDKPVTTSGTRDKWTGTVNLKSDGSFKSYEESLDHVVKIQDNSVSIIFAYDGGAGSGKDYEFKILKSFVINGISATSSTNVSKNAEKSSADPNYDFYNFHSNAAQTTVTITFTTCTLSPDKVFGGWMAYQNDKWVMIYPGDVVDSSITKLYAKWIEPDVFVLNNDTVYADRWAVGDCYTVNVLSPCAYPTNISGGKMLGAIDMDNGKKVNYADVARGNQRTSSDMFGTIFLLTLEKARNGEKLIDMSIGSVNTSGYPNYMPTGTYRSPIGASEKTVLLFTGSGNGCCRLGGDVIIDNAIIVGGGNNTGSHGDATGSAIYGYGHKLIMGVGIENLWKKIDFDHDKKITDVTIDNPKENGGAPQIFGGTPGSSITNAAIENKRIVFGGDDEIRDFTVNLGTYVIVHSGTYYNIVAGSCGTNASIGNQSNPLSTYIVLKGGITTDTLAGGCSGSSGSGDIYGNIYDANDSEHPFENNGGTFVYCVGHFTPGDDWEDTKTGDYVGDRTKFYSEQSSVIEGGSSKGSSGNQATINGSTHVFVSGKSSVWDVQAGGRSGYTHTDTSYLEITGKAVVRHVACGTITDGLPNYSNNCVDNVVIFIGGNATVASVYGAGYDTYDEPNGKSMLDNSSITIKIAGGTVGYVYGGGLRGSIGALKSSGQPSDNPLTINVIISGGTIEHDVYGGGSGGLDKSKHRTNGTIVNNTSLAGFKNTVGFSNVYGNVNVTITGADTTVKGNVYGGGMSLPILSSFNGKTDFRGCDYDVACVYGDVSVTVENNAHVKGSVFGGGKGIDVSYSNGNWTFYKDGEILKPTFGVVKKDGESFVFDEIPWYTKNDGTFVYSYNTSESLIKHTSGAIYDPKKIDSKYYFVNRSDSSDMRTVTIEDTDGNEYQWALDNGAFYIENKADTNKKYKPNADGTFVDKSGGSLAPISIIISEQGMHYSWTFSNNKFYIERNGISGHYLDFAKVEGNTNVHIRGGTVDESVYGGGAIGQVTGDTIVVEINSLEKDGNIISSSIGENVFGGGLGLVDCTSVTGDRYVFIAGESTKIDGSVYGGSSNGDDGSSTKFDKDNPDYRSDSTIVIDEGDIEGSVFGGGFMGRTWGNTNIYVGHHIHFDEEEGQYAHHSGHSESDNSTKVIKIHSIYAGGNIKTNEYDDTINSFTSTLVQGDGYIEISGDDIFRDLHISGSIMGSGNSCNTKGTTRIVMDKLENEEKLDAIHRATELTLVQSTVSIGGRSTTTGLTASIFKIGKMTLQYDSTIIIDNTVDEIEEYHSLNRDGNPTTSGSPSNKIEFTSGTTFNIETNEYGYIAGYTIMGVSNESTYGAYIIGPLNSTGGFVVMKDGIYKPAETSTSTDSRIWFISGTERKIVTINLPGAKTITENHSAPSLLPDEMDNYNEDTFGDVTINRNVKMSHEESTGETIVNIVKLMDNTSLKYVGGTFTSVSSSYSGEDFRLIKPGMKIGNDQYLFPEDYEFGMLIGLNGTHKEGSVDTLVPANHTPEDYMLPKSDNNDILKLQSMNCIYFGDPTNTPINFIGQNGGSAMGIYDLRIQFVGAPSSVTAYLGYVTLNFQEIKEETVEGVTYTMVANNVEVRVDLYIIAEESASSNNKYEIKMKTEETGPNSNSGFSEIIFPASTGFIKGKLYLDGISTHGINAGSIITVTPVMNHDNTTGWMNTAGYSEKRDTSADQEYRRGTDTPGRHLIGTMIGTEPATIKYSLDSFQYIEGEQSYFILHLTTVTTTGAEITSDIKVNLEKKPNITVTFTDSRTQLDTLVITKTYPYGTVLSEDLCPETGENFAGWYTDEARTILYNHSAPLTENISLYSKYMVQVSFDNMRGTVYTLYLPRQDGGTLIPSNLVPVINSGEEGYEPIKWYTEAECVYEWDFDTDRVKEGITLYAKWIGKEVAVEFHYKDSQGEHIYPYKIVDNEEFKVRVGASFNAVDPTSKKNVLQYVKEQIEQIISQSNESDKPFIRWQAYTVIGNDPVLINSNTVLTKDLVEFDVGSSGRNVVKLYAVSQDIAIQINMDKNSNDASVIVSQDVIITYPVDLPENAQPSQVADYEDDEHYYYRSSNDSVSFYCKDKLLLIEYGEETIGETTYILYIDNFSNIWRKTGDNAYKIKEDAKTEDHYEDKYHNLYTRAPFDQDTSYTEEQLFSGYTCTYGSEYYYPFVYVLSDASRTGYKLIGWNNESVGEDISLTPRAGTERTVRMFLKVENSSTVISNTVIREVIEVKNGGSVSEIETGNTETWGSVHIINDPSNIVKINYLAKWEAILYPVSVTKSTHGAIDAIVTKNNADGDSQSIRINGSYDASYGDRISLKYTPRDNYHFVGWTSSGECYIEDPKSENTVLIVRGQCSVTAKEIGERTVEINIIFDGNINDLNEIIVNESELEKTYVYLRNTETNEYYPLERITKGDGKTQTYRGYVPLADEYDVCVRYKWSYEETELFKNGPTNLQVIPVEYKDTNDNIYSRVNYENTAYYIKNNNIRYYHFEDGSNKYYNENAHGVVTDLLPAITATPTKYQSIDGTEYIRCVDANGVYIKKADSDTKFYLQNDIPSEFYSEFDPSVKINVTPSVFKDTSGKQYTYGIENGHSYHLLYETTKYYPTSTANTYSDGVNEIVAYPSAYIDERGNQYTVDVDANGSFFIKNSKGVKYYTGMFDEYKMTGKVEVGVDNNLSKTYYIITAYIYDYTKIIGNERTKIVEKREKTSNYLYKDEDLINSSFEYDRYVGALESIIFSNPESAIINKKDNGLPPVNNEVFKGFTAKKLYEGFHTGPNPEDVEINSINEFFDVVGDAKKEFNLNWTRTDRPAEIYIEMEINLYEVTYKTSGRSGEELTKTRMMAFGDVFNSDEFMRSDQGGSPLENEYNIKGYFFTDTGREPIRTIDVLDEVTLERVKNNPIIVDVTTNEVQYVFVDNMVQPVDPDESEYELINRTRIPVEYTTTADGYKVYVGRYSAKIVDGLTILDQIRDNDVNIIAEPAWGEPTQGSRPLTLTIRCPENYAWPGNYTIYVDSIRDTADLKINPDYLDKIEGDVWKDEHGVKILTKRVGTTVDLPVMAADQNGNTVVDWTVEGGTGTFSSDNGFQYTVGQGDHGKTLVFTPVYSENKVNVTVITSVGTLKIPGEQIITTEQRWSVDILKGGSFRLPDVYESEIVVDGKIVYTFNDRYLLNNTTSTVKTYYAVDEVIDNITTDIVLIADWTTTQYSITYNYDGSMAIVSMTSSDLDNDRIVHNQIQYEIHREGNTYYLERDGKKYDPIGVTTENDSGQYKERGGQTIITAIPIIYKDGDGNEYDRVNSADSYYLMKGSDKYTLIDAATGKYKKSGSSETVTGVMPWMYGDEIAIKITDKLFYQSQVTITISPAEGYDLDLDKTTITNINGDTVDIGTPVKQANGSYVWSFLIPDNTELNIVMKQQTAAINFMVNSQKLIDADQLSKLDIRIGDVSIVGSEFPLYSTITFGNFDDKLWYIESSLADGKELGGYDPVTKRYTLIVKEEISIYTSSDTYEVVYHNYNGDIIGTTTTAPGAGQIVLEDKTETIQQELADHGWTGYLQYVGWGTMDADGTIVYAYAPTGGVITIEAKKTPSKIDLYPYYLTTGNMSAEYTGDNISSSIQIAETDPEIGTVLKQNDAYLLVHYSIKGPITDENPGSVYAESAAFEDIGVHTVYYKLEIGTAYSKTGTYEIEIIGKYVAKFEDRSTVLKTVTLEDEDAPIGDAPDVGEWDGYRFDGWFYGDIPFDGTKGVGYYIDEGTSVTFTTKWTKITTIVFMDGETKVETRVLEGETTVGTLPAVTKEGYTLVGWFLEDGKTEITSDTETATLGKENVAHTVWEYDPSKKVTTITFMDDKTEVEVRTLTGDTVVGELPIVTKEDYKLLGWFLEDGITEITADTRTITLDDEVYAFAKWEYDPGEKITTITFMDDKTEVEVRTLRGDTVVGALPTVTKEGYILVGWFLEDGKTEITPETRTITLDDEVWAFAAWEADPEHKITIINFINGEETVVTRTYIGDVALGELPDAGKREGYTFIGWFLESGLELTPETRAITLEDENDAYSLWQKNSEPVGPTDPTERSWEKKENPDGSVTTIVTEITERPDGSVKEKRIETTTYDDKSTRVVTESFTDAEGNTTVKVDEKITYRDGPLQRVIEIEGVDGEFVVKVPVIDPLNIYDAKEELDKMRYDSVVFEMDYLSSNFKVPEVSMPILADNDYGIRFSNLDYKVTLDERTTKTLRNTGGDVTLTIHRTHPEDLTDDQERLIGDKYAVTIILKAGDQTVSQLGGTATVSVFYKGSYVYYVDNDGNAVEIPCEYNMFTGDTTFTVGHFSIYLISKEKIPEPVPEPVKEMSVLVYLAIAVLIATVIAVSVIMIRRR